MWLANGKDSDQAFEVGRRMQSSGSNGSNQLWLRRQHFIGRKDTTQVQEYLRDVRRSNLKKEEVSCDQNSYLNVECMRLKNGSENSALLLTCWNVAYVFVIRLDALSRVDTLFLLTPPGGGWTLRCGNLVFFRIYLLYWSLWLLCEQCDRLHDRSFAHRGCRVRLHLFDLN